MRNFYGGRSWSKRGVLDRYGMGIGVVIEFYKRRVHVDAGRVMRVRVGRMRLLLRDGWGFDILT